MSSFLQELGVFIPPMTHGLRMDFFLEGPFMPFKMKLDRETLGGLADMFGQMPGELDINCEHNDHHYYGTLFF